MATSTHHTNRRPVLTAQQKNVLQQLEKFIHETGYPPTRLELANILDMQPNGAQQHLAALKKKGCISIAEKTSRGLRVLIASSNVDVASEGEK